MARPTATGLRMSRAALAAIAIIPSISSIG
jgi:hypothetical protein